MSDATQDSEQAVHKAVRSGDQEKINQLINEGVNIDCLFYGWTPLLVAIKCGHSSLAIWLIERGSNVNFKDSVGTTPMEEACKRNCPAVVKALLDANCSTEVHFTDGETPLTVAAEANRANLCRVLLAGGANVNWLNSKGESPVYVCCRRDSKDVLKLLVERGADINIGCETERHLTPLMKCVLLDNVQLARILLKGKCDVNAVDVSGWTALWHVVAEGGQTLLKDLTRAGADVNFRDSDGSTVLDYVKQIQDDDMIETLMTLGAL